MTWSSANATLYNVTNTGNQTLNKTNLTTLVVTGLTPGTAYTPQVYASGLGNTGPSTKAVTVTTTNVIPAVPTVTISAINNVGYTMTWSSANATLYNVTNTGNQTLNKTNLTTLVVTGLTPGTTYTPQVYATGLGNTGPSTKSVTVTTTNVAPTPPVITITNGGTWGFTPTWSSIGASSYEFICSTQSIDVSGPMQSYAVDSNPSTINSVRVIAYSPSGKTASTTTTYTTPNLAPTITNLKCVSTASNSLIFTWTALNAVNTSVSFVMSGGTPITQSLHRNVTTAEFIDLLPATVYSITVTPYGNNIFSGIPATCTTQTSNMSTDIPTIISTDVDMGLTYIYHV